MWVVMKNQYSPFIAFSDGGLGETALWLQRAVSPSNSPPLRQKCPYHGDEPGPLPEISEMIVIFKDDQPRVPDFLLHGLTHPQGGVLILFAPN